MTVDKDLRPDRDQKARHNYPDRILGEYGSGANGPLLIIIAGIHGNERAGIVAVERVFSRLKEEQTAIDGRVVALIGNRTALAHGVRFVDRDLNRTWRVEQIAALFGPDARIDDVEAREQRELIDGIDAQTRDHRGPIILIDLHSTSAQAPPFCIISDTLQNRRIGFALSIPVILGLEEAIVGTIQEYWGDRGFIAAAIEGGQHEDAVTAERLESAVWITLTAGGLIDPTAIEDLEMHREKLRNICRGLPRVVEVIHRHGISNNDEFRMIDGFKNFSPVDKGQVVARDVRGEIQAPVGGMLVLPSYQLIGDDGFFVGRKVRRFWLRVSTVVRRMRLDRTLHWLPGVRRHPTDESALLANPDVARWIALKVFHLFGFRKCHSENGLLCFRRRPDAPIRAHYRGNPNRRR